MMPRNEGSSIRGKEVKGKTNMIKGWLLLFFAYGFALPSASAFCPSPSLSSGHLRSASPLTLVTEAEVIALVEKAEGLWAEVEALRREANDLSVQAESLGQEAESGAASAIESLSGTISEEDIEEANAAQNLSLDLGTILDEAERATVRADEVEALAEEALAASEAALEQHLIDFPQDDEINTVQ